MIMNGKTDVLESVFGKGRCIGLELNGGSRKVE